MTAGLDPTEEYDGSITVRLLDDRSETEQINCFSYEEAIEIVKENQYSVTVAKIVNRDNDVVFTSADMDIADWESIWRQERHRQSVNVEEYDCSYDSISCFADDCVSSVKSVLSRFSRLTYIIYTLSVLSFHKRIWTHTPV